MLNLFHRNRKKVFSFRNPQYIRIFAQACSDAEFVQVSPAQLPWCYQLGLPGKLSRSGSSRWRVETDLPAFRFRRIQ